MVTTIPSDAPQVKILTGWFEKPIGFKARIKKIIKKYKY